MTGNVLPRSTWRLGRITERLWYKLTWAGKRPGPNPAFKSRGQTRSLELEELLERISELEATYHLHMKLWAYPQLRKTRYWDRRKIWAILDDMAHAEEDLSRHMRDVEAAFQEFTRRPPPKPRSLLNDATFQLPPTPPTEESASGSTGATTSTQGPDPSHLPRALANKVLRSYYVSLLEARDSLKEWRARLKTIADHV